MGRKAIAIIVAIGVGLLAGAGVLYLYQQGALLPFETAKKSPAGASAPSKPEVSPPETAAQPETGQESKPTPEATGAVRPDAEPTVVPSFDVVVIEPDGEGVIAGRAAPGWQVSIETGGTKVAAATANAQGEWSAVLEKPLPAGDHALSLKITSPDGTRALSSQERVRVEVGNAAKAAAAPSPSSTAPQGAPSQGASATASQAASATASQVEAAPAGTAATQLQAAPASPAEQQSAAMPKQAQDLALAEPQGTTRAVSPGTKASTPAPQPPQLVFKTVDYEDTGSAVGSVSITGTSDPGATIKVYSNDELLATVRADRDGIWNVVAAKKLGTGQHNFRAERINAATGEATAQAMVAIERLVPKPPELAAKEPAADARGRAAPVAAPESGLRTRDIYTVRRGDTLWAIAKRYFGSGLRYPTIFEDNRETIQDPDLIHPKQQVKVPPE
jgi:nucleoid-associated protein YgaU